MSGPHRGDARVLLHVDMDAFFAAVEVLCDPSLKGRPVLVGGTRGRGVVASASYEARWYGAHSAMPMGQAMRLCPHAVTVQPHFDRYQELSRRLHGLFASVTPLVEGIGLDEAFLDVTGSQVLFGSPVEIAETTRRRVSEELGLTCSVGVGPNKLVAKLASKAAKPRASKGGPVPGKGVVVVTAGEVLDFLWPLPVESLWGVGPASAQRLRKLGVGTVGQLAALPEQVVVGALGNAAGRALYGLAWGRDPRPVEADRATKSIGHEETYPIDIRDRAELERRAVVMADSVASRVRSHGLVARTVHLKLRYGDFKTITRSRTLPVPRALGPTFARAAIEMLATLDVSSGVRLLGISTSGLVDRGAAPGEQLSLGLALDDEAPDHLSASDELGPPKRTPNSEEWSKASRAVDAVRARFGDRAVAPAAVLSEVAPPKTQIS